MIKLPSIHCLILIVWPHFALGSAFYGETVLLGAGGEALPVTFNYSEDCSGEHGRVRIIPQEGDSTPAYEWVTEIGQVHIEDMHAIWLGSTIGNVVCVRFGQGAVLEGMALFALNKAGIIIPIFQSIGRSACTLIWEPNATLPVIEQGVDRVWDDAGKAIWTTCRWLYQENQGIFLPDSE